MANGCRLVSVVIESVFLCLYMILFGYFLFINISNICVCAIIEKYSLDNYFFNVWRALILSIGEDNIWLPTCAFIFSLFYGFINCFRLDQLIKLAGIWKSSLPSAFNETIRQHV